MLPTTSQTKRRRARPFLLSFAFLTALSATLQFGEGQAAREQVPGRLPTARVQEGGGWAIIPFVGSDVGYSAPAPPPAPSAPPVSSPPAPNSPAAAGRWAPVEHWPGVAVNSVLLYTGEVLFWDAWEKPTHARIWNPLTGSFRDVTARGGLFCAAQVVLSDGRVLVVGGHDPETGQAGTPEVYIFDPATRGWSRAADMEYPRWYPSTTLLGDGRVLALSGNTTWAEWADTPEVYDPITNSWTKLAVATPDLHEDEYPLSFLLPDGRVFTLVSSTSQSRILDVAAATWHSAGLGATPVANASAAIYRPGQLLISGGGDLEHRAPASRGAATVDLTGDRQWHATGAMNDRRYMHNLVVLADGNVLAVGGSATADQEAPPATATLSTESWDPATGQWTLLAPMNDPRMYHSTALLLPDGRVLAAGGGRYNTAADFASAQIYAPPYLFRGPRPAITGGATSATYGRDFVVATPDAARIGGVALVNLGAVTHSLDMGQRYVPLSFQAFGDSLVVGGPSNANIAPAGYYMLFVIDSTGVPSVARIIHVGSEGE